MEKRLQLQTLLESLLGSRNVYFQPPESLVLKYPCIKYSRDSGDTDFADNIPYRKQLKYQIIVLDKNPDSLIPNKISELPMCRFETHYTKDNLNHDIFNMYY